MRSPTQRKGRLHRPPRYCPDVALTHDDWEALRAGLGATHVVRADGSPVEYATRVGLDSVGSRPQGASELEIVLRDPTGGEIRRIRGDLAVKLEQGAANTLTVSDEVEADGGPTVRTRGAGEASGFSPNPSDTSATESVESADSAPSEE